MKSSQDDTFKTPSPHHAKKRTRSPSTRRNKVAPMHDPESPAIAGDAVEVAEQSDDAGSNALPWLLKWAQPQTVGSPSQIYTRRQQAAPHRPFPIGFSNRSSYFNFLTSGVGGGSEYNVGYSSLNEQQYNR